MKLPSLLKTIDASIRCPTRTMEVKNTPMPRLQVRERWRSGLDVLFVRSLAEVSKVQRKRFTRTSMGENGLLSASCSTFVEINARFDPSEPCWDGYQVAHLSSEQGLRLFSSVRIRCSTPSIRRTRWTRWRRSSNGRNWIRSFLFPR